ncbi:MAG: hypothetical protein Q9214_005335 [Letrouitia sp. 1 TL-2023]
MAKLNVLISGGGIAGQMCAYWLHRAGIKVTIVERSPSLRNAGQSIEVEGPGLEIVRKMGLEDAVRARGTKEQGLAFVDEKNHHFARIPLDAPGVSFTSQYEILRGDLVDIFYNACKEYTDFMFGNRISGIEDQGNKVKVFFKEGQVKDFDLVIVADGMNSRTRGMVFDDEEPVKSLGHVCSYFTIPHHEADGTWSRFYNAPDKQILLRPHGETGTAAHLCAGTELAAGFDRLDVDGQKKIIHKIFDDEGWESQRVLQGMDDCTDFFMQAIAQVKVKNFVKGRVALLGDSAWCASPVAGMGTTLAISGAYVLAGELSRQPTTAEALKAYEGTMRPFIDLAQKIPPGAPGIACPQTKTGVWILRTVMSVLTKSGIIFALGKMPSLFSQDKGFKLPQYIL